MAVPPRHDEELYAGSVGWIPGRVNLSIAAAKGAQETRPRFRIEGRLTDGRFDAPRFLASPITGISAAWIEVENDQLQGWKIENITGKYGTTDLKFNVGSPSLTTSGEIYVSGEVLNLNVTHELVSVLPKKLQTIWAKYKPLGLIDANLNAVRSLGKWRITESAAKCRDVSLMCTYFPYPVARSQGTVTFRQGEKLTADLWASVDHASNRTPIRITADIDTPGPDFSGNR